MKFIGSDNENFTLVRDDLWFLINNESSSEQTVILFGEDLGLPISTSGETTFTLEGGLGVGNGPRVMAFDPINDNIWVPNFFSNTVSVISGATFTVIATIAVGTGPFVIAFDPVNVKMYVSNVTSQDVTSINATTFAVITPSIPVGISPLRLAYDTANAQMFVSNTSSNTLTVINTNTDLVAATIAVGSQPLWLQNDPNLGRMWVSNSLSGTLSVINTSTNSVITTIATGNVPRQITYDPANARMWVVNELSDTASVISTATNTVIQTISVLPGPCFTELNQNDNLMYVTSDFNGTVEAIDLTSFAITATADFNTFSQGVGYDFANEVVFFSDNTNSNVITLDPVNLTTFQTFSVPTPSSFLFDSVRNEMYVNDLTSQVFRFTNPQVSGVTITSSASSVEQINLDIKFHPIEVICLKIDTDNQDQLVNNFFYKFRDPTGKETEQSNRLVEYLPATNENNVIFVRNIKFTLDGRYYFEITMAPNSKLFLHLFYKQVRQDMFFEYYPKTWGGTNGHDIDSIG